MNCLLETPSAHLKRTIVIVDDDPFMLDYLGLALGKTAHEIVFFQSAEAFLNVAATLSPGIMLTDLKMPGLDGIGLLHAVSARRLPPRPTVIMSAFADIPLAVEAMKAGAVSVLQKPIMPAALLQVVDEALSMMVKDDSAWATVRLTRRERQVAEQMADGLTSKEIALKLGISYRTVEVFRSSLLRKTKSANVAALVSFMRRGA